MRSGSRAAAPFGLLLAVLLTVPVLTTGAAATPTADDAGQVPPFDDIDALHRHSAAHGFPLGPQAQAAGADILVTLVEINSDFGQETYKYDDRSNTRTSDDFENQTTNWNTALGHRISLIVELEAGDQDLPCDARFEPEAYIETPEGRLYGWTQGSIDTTFPPTCTQGIPGNRVFNITFDLDGAPPTVSGSVIPACSGGLIARCGAAVINFHHSRTDPTATPVLAGSTRVNFLVVDPTLALPQPFIAMPDETLRLFSDVGGGPNGPHEYRLGALLARNESTNLTMDFRTVPANTTFQRVDHFATRLLPGLTLIRPPNQVGELTPLDELVEKAEDVDESNEPNLVVDRVPYTLDNPTVPPGGRARMPIGGANFTQITSETNVVYTPLHVVSLYIPASMDTFLTGATSYVQPVSDRTFPVRQIVTSDTVPGQGETGTIEISLQDGQKLAGGETGTDAGDLFALQPTGFQAYDVRAQAGLSRQPQEAWVTGTIPRATFGGTTEAYDLMAFLYGAQDEFLGISRASRGLDVLVGAMRLVEGETADLPVTVTNLGTDHDDVPNEADFAINVRLTVTGLPDDATFETLVEGLSEGSSVVINVPLSGETPGTYNVKVTAASGELESSGDTTVEVISTERAREENRRWYDIPTAGAPELLLLLLALVGLMGAARRGR